MNFEKLDNEELLRLSLGAINANRDPEAVVMLKTLLEREPRHVFGQYLLAAQHAQLGMMDRAEAGFRAVVELAPDFPMARFQLGQVLVVRGAGEEARQVLAPLAGQGDAVGAYARALVAAADEDAVTAARELDLGLTLPQEIPALAEDMRRLRAQLTAGAVGAGLPVAESMTPSAPIFLTGYGRTE